MFLQNPQSVPHLSLQEQQEEAVNIVAQHMVNFNHDVVQKEELESFLNGENNTFAEDEQTAYHVFPFGAHHSDFSVNKQVGICRIAQFKRFVFSRATKELQLLMQVDNMNPTC